MEREKTDIHMNADSTVLFLEYSSAHILQYVKVSSEGLLDPATHL